MTDKEKLITLVVGHTIGLEHKLFCDDCFIGRNPESVVTKIECLVDYLIANNVVIQKQGRWIDHVCSCCGEVNPTLDMNGWGDYVSQNTNYCGNCGAKMNE